MKLYQLLITAICVAALHTGTQTLAPLFDGAANVVEGTGHAVGTVVGAPVRDSRYHNGYYDRSNGYYDHSNQRTYRTHSPRHMHRRDHNQHGRLRNDHIYYERSYKTDPVTGAVVGVGEGARQGYEDAGVVGSVVEAPFSGAAGVLEGTGNLFSPNN